MRLLSTENILKAIASSTHGCVELDIFMFMILHPHFHYEYEKGQYSAFEPGNRRKKKRMIKFVSPYTTDYDTAKKLLKEEWLWQIKTNNVCSEVAIVPRNSEMVSCKAPTEALGICWCVAKIICAEGYAAELKSQHVLPIKQTYFYTQEDYINEKREKLAQRKEVNKALRMERQRRYFSR